MSTRSTRKVAPKEKATTGLVEREMELMKLYGPKGTEKDRWGRSIRRNIIPGSIRKEEASGKLQVEIECSWENCSNRRLIYTSDLHQTRYCEQHQREVRNARRRKTDKVGPIIRDMP